MLLPGCHISRIYIFFTVFISAIIAYPDDDKTFNLKIGFDLTHGENGAPALRIRDFEDSNEFSPRAAENDKKSDEAKKDETKTDKSDKNDDAKKSNSAKIVSKKANLRVGSTSSSSEDSDDKKDPAPINNKRASSSEESGEQAKVPKKSAPALAAAKESEKESEDSSGGSGDSEPDAKRSTRGLIAGDVEADDFPKANRDDNDDRRRRKRSPEARLRNRREAEKFIQYYYENMKRKHKKVNKIPSEPRSTSYKPY